MVGARRLLLMRDIFRLFASAHLYGEELHWGGVNPYSRFMHTFDDKDVIY
jgi:hypothetical protein